MSSQTTCWTGLFPVKVLGEEDDDLGTETQLDLFSQPAQFQDEQLSSMYGSTQNDVRPSKSGAVVRYIHGLGQFDFISLQHNH
jgi:hypothetical protein